MFHSFSQRVLTLLLVASCAFMVSCNEILVKGDGDLVTETRTEKDFHAIDLSIPGTVEVFRGNTWKIEIQVEESLLPYLETKVRNGRLDVYFSRPVRDVDNLLLSITAPDLDGFSVSGSADVTAFDTLQGDQLKLDVSGSGSITLKKIDFGTINAEISGSGNLRLQGIADDLVFEVSGSGDLHTLDCPVEKADIEISGAGTARCAVSTLLKGDISGSGEIYYRGNPEVKVSVSGSGSVKKM
jgi:hypothetical protein